MFCQSVFCFQFDNSQITKLQITLEINIMMQVKSNRELANLGADLTSTDMTKGYITCIKSKINPAIQGAGENNMLSPLTVTSDDNEEALAGAAATLSPLSPPTDNSASENLSQSSGKF